jgi:hypothetical protein
MPTAEQVQSLRSRIVYASEKEADLSIQRTLGLWSWWEERVQKMRTSTPMEIQPISGPRPDAIPMGSPKRPSRPPQSASSQADAETSRRSSLRKQRSQMEAIRKRKGR